jgi:hypothetical protein
MNIARLEKVPLRKLWKHEAHSFTFWLAENLDFLSETLDFDINLVEREAAAGAFSADILAEDLQGNYVLIENQLEKTDHDHMGKLITYMSNLEAKTAIWITSEPRPEHETAVHWLNETLPSDTAFYLVKIEAFQIGDSDPAPLMTIIAGPSPESKQVGQQKKELANRHVQRLKFWEQLLEKSKAELPVYNSLAPTKNSWFGSKSGTSGFGFYFVVLMKKARVELYIDVKDAERNKQIFDDLFRKKEQLEEKFGEKLEWQRLDDRRACRISYPLPKTGLKNVEKWADLQDQMIEKMSRLHQTFQSEIKKF